MSATSVTAQRIQQLHALIAGDRRKRPTVTIEEPFTGDPIHELPLASSDDVREAAERARKAQKIWAARPVSQRAEVLKRFHDLAFANQNSLMDIIQLESGKARLNAYEEVADVAVTARHYAYNGPRLLRPKRRRGIVPLLTKPTLRRHPRGVVAVITPGISRSRCPLATCCRLSSPGMRYCSNPTHKRRYPRWRLWSCYSRRDFRKM